MSFLVLSVAALLALASANPVTHLPGGRHPLDVHDAALLTILTTVEADLNGRLNSPFYHRVSKVISAESQVVAGVKYYVTFEFAPTACLKSKVTKETVLADCKIDEAHVQTCHAHVLSQSWLKTVHTEKFDCVSNSHITGGKHPLDVTDAKVLELVSAIEAKVNAKLESPYYHRISSLLSAESQVVNGIAYFFKFQLGKTQCLKAKVTKETLASCDALTDMSICEAHLLSQPWLHVLELTSLHCSAPALANYNLIAGSLHPIDIADASLLKTLAEVEPMINNRLNSMYFNKIGKVIEAQSQVVSGTKYVVTFELLETKCIKATVAKKDLHLCDAFTAVQVCKASIWSQPWLHHTEITEIHCEARKPLAVTSYDVHTGGHHKVDVTDANLLKALSDVQPQLNDQIKSDYYYRIGKVLQAEVQVVSGTLYTVTIEVGQTQCLKAKVTKENLASCDAFAHVQLCTAKIWSQPWLDYTEITNISCHLRGN